MNIEAPDNTTITTSTPFDFQAAKKKDIELYTQWKQSGDKQALGALIKQLHPVIYSEVRRASGTLPESALSAEAKKWTVRAIQTYDPTKGVALSTHVMNYLPKVRRLNYKYQNSARLPENLQLQFTEFRNAVSHLETNLNREPTDEEIAKHLGWSKPLVVRFKGSLYEDLVESASQRPIETTQFNSNKMLMDHLMSKLDEQEKTILLNSKDISAQELADKIGVNISRLNYLKSKLRTKIMGIKEEIGMY
jgi:DNA-directed RNA polymerase specialized sigma subunit